MKTPVLVLLIVTILFIVLGIIFVGVSEMSDRDRVRQSEINYLKKQLKTQADSMQNVLSVTRDSLTIAFETIKIATKEREESHLRTQATIKTLQQIVYIKYESDSARLNAISKLYPTFKP